MHSIIIERVKLHSQECFVIAGYLAAQDVNVIAVDWSRIANLTYPLARVAVESVGIYIGAFLEWLLKETGALLSSFHLVGHSLGAHIAGVVGERFTGNLSRITGSYILILCGTE